MAVALRRPNGLVRLLREVWPGRRNWTDVPKGKLGRLDRLLPLPIRSGNLNDRKSVLVIRAGVCGSPISVPCRFRKSVGSTALAVRVPRDYQLASSHNDIQCIRSCATSTNLVIVKPIPLLVHQHDRWRPAVPVGDSELMILFQHFYVRSHDPCIVLIDGALTNQARCIKKALSREVINWCSVG